MEDSAENVLSVNESLKRKSSNRKIYRCPLKKTYREKEDDANPVPILDISHMERPTCNSANLPKDVAEWQKLEQIAYWKSRAISLELENNMLHEHLRNVYAKTIEDYSQYNNSLQNSSLEECQEQVMEVEYEKQVNKVSKKANASKHQNPVSPKEPEGKNRVEEMKIIYGDMAQKIMGMETALQLNYERHINESKPPYWPSIPLRLRFD